MDALEQILIKLKHAESIDLKALKRLLKKLNTGASTAMESLKS